MEVTQILCRVGRQRTLGPWRQCQGLLGQVLPKAGPMGIKTIPGTVINLLGIYFGQDFLCVWHACTCVFIVGGASQL